MINALSVANCRSLKDLVTPLAQLNLVTGANGSGKSNLYKALRYLLLCAALLTPRPLSLLVLNEPDTSLYPDLLPALARLIVKASKQTQVWVVSHAARLVAALEAQLDCHSIVLDKTLGATEVLGQGMLDQPAWYWPN